MLNMTFSKSERKIEKTLTYMEDYAFIIPIVFSYIYNKYS